MNKTDVRTRRISTLILTVLFAAVLLSLPGGVGAQEEYLTRGTTGLALLLKKLDGVKRVLVVGAHPDDEDTSLLAALSRGQGVETAYLSLSRGEGGQNLLGGELDEGLGILRTGELLAARALDGGRQYFTRAFDFGYSKNADETLRFWPREEILSDVMWVVRTFRPHVIVSVFSGTERDGHGQHQMAGMMAREAFRAAGDPHAFPRQLHEGAVLWRPAKLYRLARFGPGDVSVEVPTGTFDPLLGRSYHQLAMESRSQHRSQDMGRSEPMGPRSSRLVLLESRVADEGGEGLFAGVDTTLAGLAGELEGETRDAVLRHLAGFRRALDGARAGTDPLAPWGATPHLQEALSHLRRVSGELSSTTTGVPGEGPHTDGSLSLPGVFPSELRRVLAHRLPLVEEALLRSAGVVVDLRLNDDLLVPGDTVGGVLEVWNGGPSGIQVEGAELVLPPGWELQWNAEVAGPLDGGAAMAWTFTLRLPGNAEPSRPYFSRRLRDGEIYRWPEEPGLRGRPGNRPLVQGRVKVRLGEGQPLEALRAVHFRGVDKSVGEYVEPVLVVPALSVSLSPANPVWPLANRTPREFTVRVRNEGLEGRAGTLSLLPPTGWKVEPEGHPFRFSGPGSEASFTFSVEPSGDLIPGRYLLQAVAVTEDGDRYREEAVLVDYPHIPRGVVFEAAEARITSLPVRVGEGIRVGYIMGSGDEGPEILRQLGVEVDLLEPGVVRAGAFHDLDVLVLGIRAYETRPDLVAANEAVLDFSRRGGTVVVQYNKYEYVRKGIAPYPVAMSRPHDRVADETAPVRILEPDHPLFTRPNRISEDDFQGWAQERGLYFLREWDPAFSPLLELSDPGEDGKRGGLLVAPLGKGLYVYTGLAFFRQFPEGVPGAIRLFANLVSLTREDLDG